MTDKEYQHLCDLMEKSIRAHELQRFAQWFKENNYHVHTYVMSIDERCYTKHVPINEVLAEYEKELRDERL